MIDDCQTEPLRTLIDQMKRGTWISAAVAVGLAFVGAVVQASAEAEYDAAVAKALKYPSLYDMPSALPSNGDALMAFAEVAAGVACIFALGWILSRALLAYRQTLQE